MQIYEDWPIFKKNKTNKKLINFQQLEEIPKFTGAFIFFLFLKYSMPNTFTVFCVS